MLSFRQARDANIHVSEEHVDVLAALNSEEKAWMLRVAAGYNQLRAAKTLLMARANINQMTQHHRGGTQNALHGACVWNSCGLDMIRLLLRAKADTNIKGTFKGSNMTACKWQLPRSMLPWSSASRSIRPHRWPSTKSRGPRM